MQSFTFPSRHIDALNRKPLRARSLRPGSPSHSVGRKRGRVVGGGRVRTYTPAFRGTTSKIGAKLSSKPVQRIAFVKLSPEGKSYAMRCERRDLGVGDEVEVLMHAESEKAHYDDGVITDISHERWDCSCHVVNHVSEVHYSFDADGFTRSVDLKNPKSQQIESWRAQKAPYLRLVSDSARTDRRGLREAGSPSEVEDK